MSKTLKRKSVAVCIRSIYFFDRQLVVDVFHREIANEFFRRIIRNLFCIPGSFGCIALLVQFKNFFFVIRDRIDNSLSLKFVNVPQSFV